MAGTYRPWEFRFVIPQGQNFHLEFPNFIDTATGELYDFVANSCTATVEVVDEEGTPVVTFSTSGEDGVITLGTQGEITLDLDESFTSALEPTNEFGGTGHGPVYGDLVIVHSGTPWLMAKGTGEITREVTP